MYEPLEYIDNSMLGTFKACPRKFQLSFLDHWRPKDESIHLLAGGAIASALEVWRKTWYASKDHEEAETAGLEHLWKELNRVDPNGRFDSEKKNWLSLAAALCKYYADFPIEQDGEPIGAEFSFAHPIKGTRGEQIIYVGRLDLVQRAQGMNFGVDEKTTSMFGPRWAEQWDLRAQFTGYIWAMGKSGVRIDGFKIRGIKIGVSEVDTLQTIVYKTPYEINEWYRSTQWYISQIFKCLEEDYFPQNLDHSCTAYLGCEYAHICRMNEEKRREVMPVYFTRRTWNPITHTSTEEE